jgi:hypothetical protein
MIFGVLLPNAFASEGEASAFVYPNERASFHFTVPANWEKGEPGWGLSSENSWFTADKPEVTFYNPYTSCSILYIKYSPYVPWEKYRNYNNNTFSKAEIVEMLAIKEIDPDMLYTVYYGGKEYYKAEFTRTKRVDGATVLLPATLLLRFEYAYMYVFLFYGDSQDAFYSDFEALVNSVQYPSDVTREQQPPSTADIVLSGLFFAIIMLLALATIFTPLLLRYAEYRDRKRKK